MPMLRRLHTAAVLVLALALAGCGFPWQGAGAGGESPAAGVPDAGETPVAPVPAGDEVTLTLYFADHQVQHVIPEERQVTLSGGESVAEAAVRELLRGPEDPHLHPPFPEGTTVLSVQVVEQVAYVNFAEGIRIPGSASETMAVQGLTYTLTDLPGVERVQIQIGGRSDTTLGGHIELSEPLERGPILTHPILIDDERVAWLQAEADAGRQGWRRDAEAVVRFDARMAGFPAATEFTPMPAEGPHIAVFRAAGPGDDRLYQLELHRPSGDSEQGIWILVAVDPVEP